MQETLLPRRYAVFVPGRPVAQGSIHAVGTDKSGHAILTSTAIGLKAWRSAIGYAMKQEVSTVTDGPVDLAIVFLLPKPKSLKKPAPMIKRPDADKLLRAVMDALTGIVYDDDSQVTDITVSKRYAEGNQQPGVRVMVTL